MTRDDILTVVRKHVLAALDDLEPEAFDPAKSMKTLGANSLDIVEVVSRSMRELRVKVPRSELSKLANINELVDLLHESAAARALTV